MNNKNNFGLSPSNEFKKEMNNSKEITNDVKLEIENLSFDSNVELKMDASDMKVEQNITNEVSNNFSTSQSESSLVPEQLNNDIGDYSNSSIEEQGQDNSYEDFDSNNTEELKEEKNEEKKEENKEQENKSEETKNEDTKQQESNREEVKDESASDNNSSNDKLEDSSNENNSNHNEGNQSSPNSGEEKNNMPSDDKKDSKDTKKDNKENKDLNDNKSKPEHSEPKSNSNDNLKHLDQKREQVKNQSPGPSSPKAPKDPSKSFQGGNLKERLGNMGRDIAKKAGDKALEKATNGNETLQNIKDKKDKAQDVARKAQQTVEKAKKTAENAKKAAAAAKKAAAAAKAAGKAAVSAIKGFIQLMISGTPYSWIILGVILLIIAIILIIVIIVTNVSGDASVEENLENYSKTDQKTLIKLKDVFSAYPSADHEAAMMAVLLPYFPALQDGNVTVYLDSKLDEEENTGAEESLEEGEEDIEDEDDTVDDDPKLMIFRRASVRRKLKKALETIDGLKDEEEIKQALIDEYFDTDDGFWTYSSFDLDGYNGYKNMFKVVKSDDLDDFKIALANNIMSSKYLMEDYIIVNSACFVTLAPLDKVGADNLKYEGITIDLKKPGCSENCSSYDGYGSLTLKDYVMGATYADIGVLEDSNRLAARMVAAKSYILSLRNGNSNTIEVTWTKEQNFCHLTKGCNAGDITASIDTPKLGPAEDKIVKAYESAWEMSKNYYMVEKDSDPAKPAKVMFENCSEHKSGTCITKSQIVSGNGAEFKSTLVKFLPEFAIAEVKDNIANTSLAGSEDCSADPNSPGIVEGVYSGGKILHYDQKDYQKFHYSKDPYNTPSENVTEYTDYAVPGSGGRQSIASSGCGPTGLAIAISTLLQQPVSPIQSTARVCSYGACSQSGTSGDQGFAPVAKEFGLTTEKNTSTEYMLNKLRTTDAVALVEVGPGNFTTGGHLITLIEANENGQVYVADPNSDIGVRTKWWPSSAVSGDKTNGYWIIYK